MGSCRKRDRNTVDRVRGRWSAWRLFTAWIVALAVAAVILLAFGQSMASAGEPPPDKSEIQNTEVDIVRLGSHLDWTLGKNVELRTRATEGPSSKQLRQCSRRPC